MLAAVVVMPTSSAGELTVGSCHELARLDVGAGVAERGSRALARPRASLACDAADPVGADISNHVPVRIDRTDRHRALAEELPCAGKDARGVSRRGRRGRG